MPLRRITRYVLRELATPTLLGLLLYTFVMLMNHLFLVAEKSLRMHLGIELTLRLFALGIPRLLLLTIPMATLLGTLIAAGRLSADHEWGALQSAGHGPGVLLRPVALHGLLATLAGFAIYAVVVPETNWAIRNLQRDILISTSPVTDLRPRVFYDLPQDTALFVDEIRPGGDGRLESVLLIRPNPEIRGATQILVARRGDLYLAPDRSGDLALDLFEGESYSFGPEDSAYLLSAKSILNLPIPRAAFLDSLSAEPPSRAVVQDLTLPALLSEVRTAREARRASNVQSGTPPTPGRTFVLDRRISSAVTELHQRFALPLAAFVFALVALPLGIVRGRAGKGAGFAVSLLVIIVYRVVFVLTRNRVNDGSLPAVGVWIADLLVLAWAIWALLRLKRVSRSGSVLGSLFRALGSRAARLRRNRSAAETEPSSDLMVLGGTGNRFVGRLDRYIGLAFLRVLALALASTILIYSLVELQDLMDSVLRTGKSVSLVLSYFPYFLPTVLDIVLPISCLVAAVVTFTLLSRSGELVAIRAAGISLRRATVPVVILTSGLCGLLFLVQDRIAPVAHRKAQAVRDEITNRAPRTHGVPVRGRWSFGPDGETLYHYRLYNPERQEYMGFSMLRLDRHTHAILEHRFGETARLTPQGWSLEGGWLRALERPEPATGAAGVALPLERFEGWHEVPVGAPTDLAQQQRGLADGGDLADETSLAELKDHIDSLKDSGYDITQLRVAYYGKFSRSMAPLVMVLLGLPFGFRVGRRGSLYGVGVALLLVLVYWATFAVFNALGLGTFLPAPVAAWAPNVLFGLFGLYLLLYVKT